MKKLLMFLFIWNLSLTAVEPGSFEEKASKFKWELVPQKDLPNVLILGDSISIGYTLDVRNNLQGKANVYRPVENDKPINCGDTQKGIKGLDQWLKTQGVKKWDVIHFNWGLHDLKRIHPGTNFKEARDPSAAPVRSAEAYKQNMEILVKRLKATGAQLIFANTTNYPLGVVPCRLPKDAVLYNNSAQEVMEAEGIQINDLYNFTKERLKEIQIPMNVHFTKEGSKSIVKEVSREIEAALKL